MGLKFFVNSSEIRVKESSNNNHIKAQSQHNNSIFRGRINFATYFMGRRIFTVIASVSGAIGGLILFLSTSAAVNQITALTLVIVCVIVGIYDESLPIRRAHDFNYSRLKLTIGHADYGYQPIFSEKREGDVGPNKYGPPPKPGVDWLALVKFW